MADYTASRLRNCPPERWTPELAIPESILKLPAPLSFFRILRFLKSQKRTGWLDRGVSKVNAESIADHMYRMAVMCMLAPEMGDEDFDGISLDSTKCVKIALVHDLAEAVVGDLTPHDPVGADEKHWRERITMQYLSKLIEPINSRTSRELEEYYLEYENQSSPEARFVKDIDKFEFLLQTIEYERDVIEGVEDSSVDVSDFMYAKNLLKTKTVKSWAHQVIEERHTMFPEN
ncbi:HD domain-containing protein [Dipodascopsis uninucleata]